MSAHCRRIIHEQAQVSSLETYCSDLESQTIVLMSKYIVVSWVFAKLLLQGTPLFDVLLRSCFRAALVQSCPLHTSSVIARYRKVRRLCVEELWYKRRCAVQVRHIFSMMSKDVEYESDTSSVLASESSSFSTGGHYSKILSNE